MLAAPLCLLLTMAGAPNPAVKAPPVSFYVAPTGSDASPGSLARPFQTVERARDAVRRLRRPLTRDVDVVLAAGAYRLTHTLTLDPADSGQPGHPITYCAMPGAHVVLSGGRVVHGWKSAGGGRFRAHVDLPGFRQLWVNGVRAQRAQGPVPAGLQSWDNTRPVIHPAQPDAKYGRLEVVGQAGYRVPDARLASWRNPADIELTYTNAWSYMVCRVASIRREGDGAIITMAQPGFFLSRNKAGVQAGAPDTIENAIELLDKPGEWYFDRHARELTYLPRKGEDIRRVEVVAPALERLVWLRGTPARPVHDVRFTGITFSHATWMRPSTFGHPDVQANFISPLVNGMFRPEFERGYSPLLGECVKSPANVVASGARSVRFDRCTFAALGSAGLDLENGAQGNTVERCTFRDISGSGIQIGDVTREDHHPADPRRIVKGNRVTDCLIERCGAEYQGSVGVFCGYTEGSVIAHNEIHSLPYTGISVGWGWGVTDAGGGAYASPIVFDTPTTCRANRIEYNHIHHIMLRRSDGGGIYTLSRQPGTTIRGNHIHDNGPGVPGGIYLDEGSADMEVTGNLIYAVATPMNYNNLAQNRKATCRVHDNVLDLVRTGAGVRGRALLCTGSSAFEAPDAPGFDTPQVTVEAWVNLPSIPGGEETRRWVVCKGANEWDNGNLSLLVDGADVAGYLNIGGGRENHITAKSSGSPLRAGRWQHLAMTYDGTDLRVYVDGDEVARQAVGRARSVSKAPLTIGARGDRFGPGAFRGRIDEVRVYSRALSPSEIRADMAADRGQGAGASAEGLAGRWGFENVGVVSASAQPIAAEAGIRPSRGSRR